MSSHLTSSIGSAEATVTRPWKAQRALVICGIFSSLFYAGMDLVEGSLWPAYNWISQEFSRLSAVGAPSRPLHLVLGPVYTVLVVAFGLGVWSAAGRRRSLRIVGGALISYALVSLVWPQFYPEDPSRPVSASTNTMHIVLTILTVFSWMIILGFGAAAFGKRFRLYSIGTLATVLVFGGLTGAQTPALIAGQSTPWLGLTERINIYSFMLWVVVLASILLRAKSQSPRVNETKNRPLTRK